MRRSGFERRLRRIADVALVCVMAGALLYAIAHLPGAEIGGGAGVIDGDSLRVDGQELRLFGIDAPEAQQTCLKADGTIWPCGREAARHLRALVRSGAVICRGHGTDRYDRLLARCKAGATDLNAQMVVDGYAVTTLEGMALYRSHESAARDAGLGLWQGPFVRPADWRAAQR